ncbi:hypothetical protein Taro_045488 [Colocasia esculenta]|uniref:Uncharacterized protein n=1 Tax=Colocasia esculenta TaxID=4460 RepID=A0A843WPL6_COLES|nr:hypothetical protein [Colocasia esculenta]
MAKGDATIDASTKAVATSVYRGAHGDRDTRPYVHLKDFVYESAPHKYDCHLMAYLFRKSLDGPTLEWIYSLPPEEAEDFRIVQERFLQ